jgi:hypothetical protein
MSDGEVVALWVIVTSVFWLAFCGIVWFFTSDTPEEQP